jgi:hypothetical protein
LTIDASGNLFGVAAGGGAYGNGVAFELIRPKPGATRWTYSELYSFCDDPTVYSCADGAGPVSRLLLDGSGKLYGLTGGSGYVVGRGGAAFELIPPHTGETAWTEKVLGYFCPFTGCTGGHTPQGDLTMDAAGDLFGVTMFGAGRVPPPA